MGDNYRYIINHNIELKLTNNKEETETVQELRQKLERLYIKKERLSAQQRELSLQIGRLSY